MNSCGARVCVGMIFSLREDVRRRLRLAAHKTNQAAAPNGQELAHVNICFESRPCCLEISAQQDATTSGRVILWRRLTVESRPEERVQQVQVWRSWRLEDDVSSREWHVFFVPRHDWDAPRFDWNVSVRALQLVETVQGTQHVNAEANTTLAVY